MKENKIHINKSKHFHHTFNHTKNTCQIKLHAHLDNKGWIGGPFSQVRRQVTASLVAREDNFDARSSQVDVEGRTEGNTERLDTIPSSCPVPGQNLI